MGKYWTELIQTSSTASDVTDVSISLTFYQRQMLMHQS